MPYWVRRKDGISSRKSVISVKPAKGRAQNYVLKTRADGTTNEDKSAKMDIPDIDIDFRDGLGPDVDLPTSATLFTPPRTKVRPNLK